MNDKVKPFIKWAGGKRQLLKEIIPCIPKFEGCYYEPFIGGGAVLFDLLPQKAVINDYNSEIALLYKVVRDNPRKLVNKLAEHEDLYEKNGADYYYAIRSLDRDRESYIGIPDIEKAARTIFLNKTCFNGLYRVNKMGCFNTPIGRYKNPEICCEEQIINASNYLKKNRIRIMSGDYSVSIKKAKEGDFVYIDPPYYPISKTSSFTDYTQKGFGEKDQVRLYEDCVKLNMVGVKFLQSNSDCDYIRQMYKDFYIRTVSVKRSINSNGEKRIGATEVLIANYEI